MRCFATSDVNVELVGEVRQVPGQIEVEARRRLVFTELLAGWWRGRRGEGGCPLQQRLGRSQT
jgi:hypothetical protein